MRLILYKRKIINIIQKQCKICIFLVTPDIDYFKYDEYMPTSTFLDVFYTHNVFPVLSKPTHVTKHTANLIDHILTNNFDMSTNHKQRIICNDLSEHYAIFHVSECKKAGESELNYSINKDMQPQDVIKFSEEPKVIRW